MLKRRHTHNGSINSGTQGFETQLHPLHTTYTTRCREEFWIEIEDSSLGARIFLSFRLLLVLNFMNSISILVLFLIMDS